MSEKYPPGTKKVHREFCVIEKWLEVADATGKPVGHHYTYELIVPNGNILRTRISHPADGTTYGSKLWGTIVKHQLEVTYDEFWACVRDRDLPERGSFAVAPPGSSLPASVLLQLTTVVGLAPEDAITLTLAEASRAIADHWQNFADNQ